MEYEVKYKIEDKEGILKKLRKLGAKDLGENLESDIYLNLEKKGVRIRRINQNKGGFLTVKKLVDEGTRAKVREETEVKVNNIEKLVQIFKFLGFSELKRKEKIRHTFKLANVLILIDKVPFMGYFIELEAVSDADLKKASKKLGLDYNQAEGDSYDNMFFKYYIKNARKYQDTKVKIVPIFKNEKEFLKDKADFRT